MVLVCEHASRHIPLELQRLGLDEAAAQEHIAWDIGALALAEQLSRHLDAPLLAAGYSRLLIDLNRPLEAPDSIPPPREIYPVPGNHALSEAVRRYRQDCLFHPFHDRLAQLLDQRQAAGLPPRGVGVHSVTPGYHGRPRPLVAGVLYRNAGAYAERILDGLRRQSLEVAGNQPYAIDPAEDTTVPVHGDARGLEAVLLEIRNDGLRTPEAVRTWAERLHPWL
ncbi:N-formylglutamate amidohydrolase [Pseudomonas aeruginosa]|nr:N-formylglutamate amidohydrolase [Pseudomonas aeruginosa]